MEITEQLLLNLSLLLILVFFFQNLAEKLWNHPLSKWQVLLFYIIAILLCFTVSIKNGKTTQFDLSHIPLIIGSLYNGPIISLILFSTTIGFRALFGVNSGFVSCFIVFSIHTLICMCIHKWFSKQTMNRKIFVCTALSVFNSIMLVVIMDIFDISILSTELMISYIVVPALGTSMVVYTIESIKKNEFLKHQINISEKIHTVSNMAAAISHEVRNPITTIRGFLQLLRDHTFDEEKRNEFITISLQELDRAEKIINSYLNFSKPAPKKLEPFNINTEIFRLSAVLEPYANMNAVVIDKDLAGKTEILGDPLLFEQSMINIMKNCIESMTDGGTLLIKTSCKLGGVQIIITDTGIGMTHEQLLKLGEPYFTTKGSKGTGLGMMVTFNIIKAMHGSIKVESTLGKGTTFKIEFPAFNLLDQSRKSNLTALYFGNVIK